MNWQLPTAPRKPVHLKQRLFKQHGTPKFSIIPPVWNEDASEDSEEAVIYPHVWRRAARAIRLAERILVVGFSFAATDLQAQSVFRLALDANRHLRLLVIASPTSETRGRIREVFDVPLARRKAVVRQFSDFADLVDHLDAALT